MLAYNPMATPTQSQDTCDWIEESLLELSVCEEREFLEIAEDFSNPCEIFREAISNAFDAGATELHIALTT